MNTFRYFFILFIFSSLGANARLRTEIDQIQYEMRICSCLVFFIYLLSLHVYVARFRACLVMFPHGTYLTYCKYQYTDRQPSTPAPIDLT